MICSLPLSVRALSRLSHFSYKSIFFNTTLLDTWGNWPPKSYTFMGQLPSKTLQIRCRVVQNQYFDSKRKYMICSLPLSVRALSRLSHFSYKSIFFNTTLLDTWGNWPPKSYTFMGQLPSKTLQIRCRVVQNQYFDSKRKYMICSLPLSVRALSRLSHFSYKSIFFNTTLLDTWGNWPPKSYTFMGQLPSKTLQIRCRVVQNQYFDSKRKYMICSLPLSVRALSRLSHFSYKSVLFDTTLLDTWTNWPPSSSAANSLYSRIADCRPGLDLPRLA